MCTQHVDPSTPRWYATFARLGRLWLALGLVATSFSLISPPVYGQTGVLLLPDLCDDVSQAFNVEWARIQAPGAPVYLMRANGDVVALNPILGIGAFADIQTLYIFGHGSPQAVGGIQHANFAAFLHAAHPKGFANINIYSCFAASQNNAANRSLTAVIADHFPDAIGRLRSCADCPALTGNGNGDLAFAQYRCGAVRQNQNDQAQYDIIVANIRVAWSQQAQGPQGPLEQQCQGFRGAQNWAGLFQLLMDSVALFSNNPLPNEPDRNYLRLVRLNTGGDDLGVCGALAGIECQ